MTFCANIAINEKIWINNSRVGLGTVNGVYYSFFSSFLDSKLGNMKDTTEIHSTEKEDNGKGM